MKKDPARIPKGVALSTEETVSLSHPAAQASPLLYAAPLKRRARAVMTLPKAENRLTLILGLFAFLTLGLAVPAVTDCLLVTSDLLNALSEGRFLWWPLALTVILNLVYFLLITAPLGAALFRMAVLMTEAYVHSSREGGVCCGIHPGELLYPFTSAEAYRRCLTVALRGVGSFCLATVPSVALVVSALWWVPRVCQGRPVILYVLLWVTVIGAAAGLSVLISLWVLRFSGYAYFVFAHPETSLAHSRRALSARSPSGALPLWLTVGDLGQLLLAAVALLLPLLPHTLPYLLLSRASYGRYLYDLPVNSAEADVSAIDLSENGTPMTLDAKEAAI